jgi:hypothetical protein
MKPHPEPARARVQTDDARATDSRARHQGGRPRGDTRPLVEPNHVCQGRVIRTLWPPQPGTQQPLQHPGPRLLCVRYRDDPIGLRRFTTVELVVDVRPTPRAKRARMAQWWYPIAPAPKEHDLHALLRVHGARWDRDKMTWYVPGHTIQRLALEDRIAAASPRNARRRQGG